MAAEARLTFAAQAALLAKSQIATWQMENAEAKWRIVGWLMNYSLAVQWQRERGGGSACFIDIACLRWKEIAT